VIHATRLRVGSPGNQEAFGAACYPANARTASALETEMLEYLGRMRFDDGEINRTRAAGNRGPKQAASDEKFHCPMVANFPCNDEQQ
jgi:hypothetical protein